MKLRLKQKEALEKITGKPWDSWNSEAVKSYFAFTDRGQRTELFKKVWKLQAPDVEFDEVEQDLWDLLRCHKFHPVDVELWKQDFKSGLLSLDDFFRSPLPPENFLRHVAEIYVSVHKFLPYRWRWWFNRGNTPWEERAWQWAGVKEKCNASQDS